MSQRRDGRVDVVPCAVLSKLTLLTHTEAAVRDLLDDLGQFLSVPGCGSDELARARFQCCCMAHKHDIAATRTGCPQNEPSDVVHSFVEFQVGLIVFQVLQSHLGKIRRVYGHSTLAELHGGHECWKSPTAPRKPLKESVFYLDLNGRLLQALHDGSCSLDAAESWR